MKAMPLRQCQANLVSDELRSGRLCIIKSDAQWTLPPFGLCYREGSMTIPARTLAEELTRVASKRRQEVKDMLTALDLSVSDDAG